MHWRKWVFVTFWNFYVGNDSFVAYNRRGRYGSNGSQYSQIISKSSLKCCQRQAAGGVYGLLECAQK